MKLREFTSETLMEVSAGVNGAKSKSEYTWIAPGSVEGKAVWAAHLVEFDVAVSQSTAGEGGISVVALGKLEGSHSREQVNRVKFSIPVYFEGIGGPN